MPMELGRLVEETLPQPITLGVWQPATTDSDALANPVGSGVELKGLASSTHTQPSSQ